MVHDSAILRRPAALLVSALLAVGGCSGEVPDASRFAGAGADAAGSDTELSTTDGATADAAPGEPDTAAGPADAAGDGQADDATAGPTCAQALTCLVDQKQWRPGQSVGGCRTGLQPAEADQIDALLTCVDGQCLAQFEAWANGGGPGELSALYGCLIEKCTVQTSVCIGGHGDQTCAQALKCLAGCTSSTDPGCTVPCLQPTSEPQSEKTGKFLACVFGTCPLAELATCAIPLSCGLKCPELAP